MIDELVSKGFDGIYLNRLGYPDRGVEIGSQVSEILRVAPLASEDASFWDLRPYAHIFKRSQLERQ
ncbi:MAG TPA: hypothetical protein VIJ14_02980 [Rhabdochlamydiaceae bacterium]